MKSEITELQLRRQCLMRAFWINMGLVVLVWVLAAFVPGTLWIGMMLTGLSAAKMHFAIVGALGLWVMFDFALFLVPALATGGVLRREQ